MLRHIFKLITALVILCSIHFNASAEEEIRYYSVEVILLENTAVNHNEAEIYARATVTQPGSVKEVSSTPELNHTLGMPFTIDTRIPYKSSLLFTPLHNNSMLLIDAAKRIEKSNSRRVLMHKGWIQPGLAEANAVRVNFRKELSDTTNKQYDSTSPSPYVEAGIKVILSRYLHVDAEITYVTGMTTADVRTLLNSQTDNGYAVETSEAKPLVYQMKQKRRRMRSTELHYLDHPVVSMLILITPYELEKDSKTAVKRN